MNNVKAMSEYAAKCGLDVTVDDDTLLLKCSGILRLGDLPEKETLPGAKNEERNLNYYVSLDYPRKQWGKDTNPDGILVSTGENGVFVISPEKRLMMFCPIYECHGAAVRKNLCLVYGHEQAGTIVLNDLEESFLKHTR